MREVRDEPVMAADQPLELVGFVQRQLIVLATVPAGQVDVMGFLGAVVLGTGLDV